MADDFELERLRTEIAQEKQMKEMLEQSMLELQHTVNEMGKRIDGVGNESNEWKTRYETQAELNQQLSKQSILLHDKIDEARNNIKDSKLPKTMRTLDDSQLTPQFVTQMEREKNSLESQLRDLEWRLDQESKAFHKANEERKQYVVEINAAKNVIDMMRARQRDQLAQEMAGSPRSYGSTSNIPNDSRIIDPRKGPIKKTAAARNLPGIN